MKKGDSVSSVIIRKGTPEDARHFSRLALYTAPRFLPNLFGSRVKTFLDRIFRHRRNYFSYEYSYFIESAGEVAGMCLSYGHREKKKSKLRMNFLVLKYLKWGIFRRLFHLLRSDNVKGKVEKNEHYLHYLSVYSKFRRLGLGRMLLERVEEDARKRKSPRIALDVRVDNEKAIRLYQKLGYRIQCKSPVFRIRKRRFESFRMVKEIAAGAGIPGEVSVDAFRNRPKGGFEAAETMALFMRR